MSLSRSFAISAIAITASFSVLSTQAATTVSQNARVDYSCMKRVVEAREDAILAARAKEATALQAALTRRKAELGSAWLLTTRSSIKQAVVIAHTKYALAASSAQKTSIRERLAAWKSYQQSALGCRVPALTDIENASIKAKDVQ